MEGSSDSTRNIGIENSLSEEDIIEYFVCAADGNLDGLRDWIENKNVNPSTTVNRVGLNVMHYAIGEEYLYVIEYLLSCMKPGPGEIWTLFAIVKKSWLALEMLIEHGFRVQAPQRFEGIYLKDMINVMKVMERCECKRNAYCFLLCWKKGMVPLPWLCVERVVWYLIPNPNYLFENE